MKGVVGMYRVQGLGLSTSEKWFKVQGSGDLGN